MKGKITFFRKCIAFRPSVLGMGTRSSEGVIYEHSDPVFIMLIPPTPQKASFLLVFFVSFCLCLFGLSKERPILGDHPKAHILYFMWNPADFMWNPPANLINQIIQEKLFSFMECSGKAMSHDFTWNPLDFERPTIARNGMKKKKKSFQSFFFQTSNYFGSALIFRSIFLSVCLLFFKT